MLKKLLPILLALTVLVTACAPEAAPTMSAADIQGTAASAAWTMVAATQAAIPTNTPVPPTEVPSPTSLPTFTPEPLLVPTLPPLALASPTMAAAAAAPADPNSCLKTLNIAEAGPLKNLNIENRTPSQINVSLNLYKPNLFGQCGSLSTTLAKGGTKTVRVSSGYWYAFAWVLDPPSQVGYNFVIGTGDSSGGLKLVVEEDRIIWYGQ